MADLALPQHEAARLNRAALVNQARYDIAKEVFANLVAVNYQQAMLRAQQEHEQEHDPFGTGVAAGDGESDGAGRELKLAIDVGCPAGVAVAAADALLRGLGILQPPARPAINEGPR